MSALPAAYSLIPKELLCSFGMIQGKDNISFWQERLILLASLLFAYYYNTLCATRGFFAFDQSIIFDGAYRLYSGQIPYKDFVTPNGLPAYYFQALLFHIFGVSYTTYIFAASLSNVVATILSVGIFRCLYPTHKVLSLICALLTAVFFYPPFATPFADHSAFLLSLLTLLMVLYALNNSHNSWVYLFAGVFSGLSFACKQNIGLIMFPLPYLLLFAHNFIEEQRALKDLLMLFLGFALCLLSISCVIWMQADLSLFVKYFFLIPYHLGVIRLNLSDLSLLNIISIIVLLTLFVISFFFLSKNNRQNKNSSKNYLSITLCTYLMFASHIFLTSMKNNPALALVNMGLIVSLGAAIFYDFNKAGKLVKGIYILFCFTLLYYGMQRSYHRMEQEAVIGSSFRDNLKHEKLDTLKWGKPTYVRRKEKIEVSEDDFMALIAYLEKTKDPFFVFPDHSILYGILDQAAPGPLIWYHKGLTYSQEYDEQLDSWLVQSLKKNNVELVVFEKRSFFETKSRLNDFPLFKQYLENSFVEVERFGLFIVFEKGFVE